MYENKTATSILTEMKSGLAVNVNKDEGSLIHDALSPAANQMAKQYIELDAVLRKAFAQTSFGEWLDKRAAEFAITRKDGANATVDVTFVGTNGTVIPSDFLVQTQEGLRFATLSSGTITGGQVVITCEASEAGTAYNVNAGTIVVIVTAKAGLTSVTNSATATGGSEPESDEDLLERLLVKARTPATSGNSGHYIVWAREVDGVGGAKCFPVWNGPGTVKVVVIDENKQPANSTIITNVGSYIETVRPVGATVTVESATALNVNVTATILLKTGYNSTDVKATIESNITEYLKTIAFEKDYVSYAQIGNVIFDSEGVADYSGLIINSSTSNVAIGSTQVAVKGTVTIYG